MQKEGEPGEGKVFRDVNEALMAYNEHVVSLHAAIKVRITKVLGDKTVSKIINCTVGRLIFNENITQAHRLLYAMQKFLRRKRIFLQKQMRILLKSHRNMSMVTFQARKSQRELFLSGIRLLMMLQLH